MSNLIYIYKLYSAINFDTLLDTPINMIIIVRYIAFFSGDVISAGDQQLSRVGNRL